MYAVIVDSGTQFCVEEGQTLTVDLKGVEPGEKIEFDRVLLVGGENGTIVGKPLVEGAKVVASVIDNFRDKKVHVRVYKRRKNYRKHKGHRQPLTQVRIEQIVSGS